MEELIIVKIGGNVIDNPGRLSSFLARFAKLPQRKLLVHGGGAVATKMGERLGIQPNYVNGRRITDEATMELVTMVYGGLLNKQIVAGLQSGNCNAIGLSGCDGAVLKAHKRPVGEIDYGFVGDLDEGGVNIELLKMLIDRDFVPVVAPLTFGDGVMFNTNADTISQELAKALAFVYSVKLIYCFEKPGLLSDPSDDRSVIHSVNKENFKRLQETGVVSGGMIPKLDNAFAALHAGVHKVIIGQAEELAALIAGSSGTQIES
jgi:acetylglutamate kinase